LCVPGVWEKTIDPQRNLLENGNCGTGQQPQYVS
jgi:hypothetical protein